jgi:hypothetical protein
MDVSRFLGKVIGLYFLIISVAIVVNQNAFFSEVSQLTQNGSLMFVTGVLTLIFGLLMVVSHNIWEWGWKVIITLLSWLTLLKGASMLIFPSLLEMSAMSMGNSQSTVYAAVGFQCLLGILLTWFGFRRK